MEFLSLAEIRNSYGAAGVTGFEGGGAGSLAEFTDDTQMTLFTAEGLLVARQFGREDPTEEIWHAYLRWLHTQRARAGGFGEGVAGEGWLLSIPEMWKIRAPGSTCLTALGSGRMGTPGIPINHSKGCGGVMRVAPVGLVFQGEAAFNLASKAAAITHGHASGYLSAGVLGQVIAEIIRRTPAERDARSDLRRSARRVLLGAIHASLETLSLWPNSDETLAAVRRALDAARTSPATAETVEMLGGGWVGEEALAIALFCALAYPDNFAAAVKLAANHTGDSDSTAAITGNLLGALLGVEAIPPEWLAKIELRGEIEKIARALIES